MMPLSPKAMPIIDEVFERGSACLKNDILENNNEVSMFICPFFSDIYFLGQISLFSVKKFHFSQNEHDIYNAYICYTVLRK